MNLADNYRDALARTAAVRRAVHRRFQGAVAAVDQSAAVSRDLGLGTVYQAIIVTRAEWDGLQSEAQHGR